MAFETLLRSLIGRTDRLSILGKGVLLVALPLLFQLGLIGLITSTGQQERDADESVAHSQMVLQQAEHLVTQLVSVETSCRGFVLTGDPVFVEPFESAQKELPEFLQALSASVSHSAKQQAAVAKIESDTARWLEFQAENARLVRAGARDEAIVRIGTLTGKQQMDELRREIADFQLETKRFADEESELRERNHRFFRVVIIVGAGMSILLAALSALVFTRGISQRLAAVVANIQNLALGHALTPPISGSDEISKVDQAFWETTQTLAQSREEMAKHTRLLQSILDNMGDGICVVDEAGKFLVFNQAAKRIVGLGPIEGEPREWSERYGVFYPDQTTLYPSEWDAPGFCARCYESLMGLWLSGLEGRRVWAVTERR